MRSLREDGERIQESAACLRALARLAWHGFRAHREGRTLLQVPRRRLAVERREVPIRSRAVFAYLAATDGEGVTSAASAGGALPPLFPAVWEASCALELLAEAHAALSLGGVVHRADERVQLRPLYVDDRIRCRVELDRAEPCSHGVRLTLVSRNWNGAGQLCSRGESVLLVRAPSPPDQPPRELPVDAEGRERATPAEPASEWRELAHWAIRPNQGRRYARVSGDFNPIHLWSWTARPFGFPRPILHGACTEAMVAHALIRTFWNGEPAALRRLQIEFRAPLPLPAHVRLLVREQQGHGTFRVVEDGGSATVYADGSFVGG